MNPVLIYLFLGAWVFVSLITFFLYKIDKAKAIKGAWRIKESTLLLSSLCLGSIGGLLGMYMLRHKTKHWYFILINWLALILHLLVLYFILNRVGVI